jgi:ribosomal protein S18 acetylase RimI-like enzyme
VCPSCTSKTKLEYTTSKARTEEEMNEIRELVRRFWGEERQLTFDREFEVTDLPAYVAKAEDRLIGFVSVAEVPDAVVIVALGVLPRYQGSGVGSGLVEKIEDEAARMHKERVLVSTSNDDLPALAFYQSMGFQIYEVRPNVIAEKHGGILRGIGGLPVRDELRLRKTIGAR